MFPLFRLKPVIFLLKCIFCYVIISKSCINFKISHFNRRVYEYSQKEQLSTILLLEENMKKYKKLITSMLTLLIFTSSICQIQTLAKTASPTIVKNILIYEGTSKTVKLKPNGSTIKRVKWVQSNQNLSLKVLSRTRYKITAKKSGTTKLTAKVIYRSKNTTHTKNLVCKVFMPKKNMTTSTPVTTTAPTATTSTTPSASAVPTSSPTVTACVLDSSAPLKASIAPGVLDSSEALQPPVSPTPLVSCEPLSETPTTILTPPNNTNTLYITGVPQNTATPVPATHKPVITDTPVYASLTPTATNAPVYTSPAPTATNTPVYVSLAPTATNTPVYTTLTATPASTPTHATQTPNLSTPLPLDDSICEDTVVLAQYEYADSTKTTITKCLNRETATKAVIPSTVTTIESHAFSDCRALTTVIIQHGVVSIGASAFANCTQLESIVLPNSVKDIGTFAFFNCNKLTKVTLPNTITTLSLGIFSNCYQLENLVLPASLTTIDYYAFSNCYSLRDVIFSNGLTCINGGAFQNCISLTNVRLPNSLTAIGFKIFEGCNQLLTVTIPDHADTTTKLALDKLSSIFEGCTNLCCISWKGQNYGNAESFRNAVLSITL